MITPGFLAVLAHAWKLLLKVEDSYRQADGLQGSWDALASHIIDTISLVAPSGTNPLSPLNYNLLYGVLRFVWRFDGLDPKPSANLPPLCAALASRGVVESLTIAVSALTQTTTSDPTSALETILLILALVFLSPGGYHQIPVAARNGFFHGIVEGGKRRLLDQHVRVILDQILAPSGVYYTVLSGISEAFYDAHNGLTASEAFRRSPIFEDWSVFAEIVSYRLKIMKRFDDRIGVSQRGCDNPEGVSPALSSGMLLVNLAVLLLVDVGLGRLGPGSLVRFILLLGLIILQARRRLRPLVSAWSDSAAEESTPNPPPPPSLLLASAPPTVPVDDVEMRDGDGDETSENGSLEGSVDFPDPDAELLTAFEHTMDEADESTLTRDNVDDVVLDMDGGDSGFVFDAVELDMDAEYDLAGFIADDGHDLGYDDDY
ncbi:hypothetical protein DFH08DRAFT_965355 [Mycena albidolilacea]|uniref:Uncharacterized protein n=1 Tax=Mycena albidolilacea TaxID=1033008 RepID=A0AAD6ZRX1_9AGAR|nr:hypothetical protein DFH08DRAFT_965355 [Mycena albidolilacea]